MNDPMRVQVKTAKKAAAIVAVLALGFVAVDYFDAHATIGNPPPASDGSVPVIGIMTAESRGSGCTIKVSQPLYESTIPSSETDPNAADADFTMPPGNTDCGKIYLSGSGPFTSDFRIGVRLMRKQDQQPVGWGPWGWSPWASDVASGNASSSWSPWVGALVNVGSDPGYAYYQVAVDKRPLPAGATVSNIAIELQFGDYNNDSSGPNYCGQPPGEVDGIVATNGGWSSSGGDTGTGWTAATDVADCARIALASADLYNAQFSSTNIPLLFNAGETKTADANNQPLEISMANTGNLPWTSDVHTPVPGSAQGTCQVDGSGWGMVDAPSLTSANVGQSCSAEYLFSSSQFKLRHLDSAFSTSPSGDLSYEIPITVTQTVASKSTTTGCSSDESSGSHLLSSGCHPVTVTTQEYDVTYSAPSDVDPGATVQFPLTSITAPGDSGSYQESWQMYNVGENLLFGNQALVPITVGGGATIIVESNWPATWNVWGLQGYAQSTTSEFARYDDVPVPAVYGIANIHDANGDPGDALLRSVNGTVAGRGDFFSGLVAMLKQPFNSDTAYAQSGDTVSETTTVILNGAPLQPGTNPIVLQSGDTEEFDLDWGIAGASTTCEQANTCGGTITAPLTAGLSAAPSSGAAPLSVSLVAAAQNGVNTYNFTFWSDCSYPDTSVSDAVTACGTPLAKDDGIAAFSEVARASYPNAGTYHPLLIVESGNSAVRASATVTATAVGQSQPGGTGTGTGSGSSGSSGSCSSFTASPSAIIQPEQSTLNWSCTGVTSCNVFDATGNLIGSGSSVGSTQVSPTSTTVYTLNCGTTSDLATTSVQVNNPGVIEINP